MQKMFLTIISGLLLLFAIGCNSSSRLNFSGFYIPLMGISEDVDGSEPGGGIEFDADLNTGHGYGVRAGLESDEGKFGIGLLYITSEHQERWLDSDVTTHSGYLDLYGRRYISDTIFLEADFAAGGAVFDFKENVYDDTGGGALLARGSLGWSATDNIDLHIGGGGFMWGWPGETVGKGGFFTTGVSVRF